MGYESKVVIAQETGNHGFTEVIAELDLCKMGYDNGWRELFDKPFDGEVYIENEDEPTTEDKYGAKLKYATVDEVFAWCELHHCDDGSVYWRQCLLESLLKEIKLRGMSDSLIVIHYGY